MMSSKLSSSLYPNRLQNIRLIRSRAMMSSLSQAAVAPSSPRISSPRKVKPSLEDQLRQLNEDVSPLSSDPMNVLEWSMERFNGRLAMSTSFGIQSAVLLHMATQVKPDVPVVWVDTGYLPKETYQYAETLRETLNLNLIVKSNDQWTPARMEAVYGKLWEKGDAQSHALYGKLRKMEPLVAGLNGLKQQPLALLSGLRSSQTAARANMPQVGFQQGRFKVLPILSMTDDQVADYFDKFDLPRHPLESQGYVTVGDWHSSRPVAEGEDARKTRFGGKFQECGLHVEEPSSVEVEEKETVKSEVKSFEATGVEALNIVEVNNETDMAVILVKKINEDGSYCRKCIDVQNKLEKDDVQKWIGDTVFADLQDTSSDGLKLASHFGIKTAPFFLIRKRSDIEEGKEWKVISSYLQLKKMLKAAHNNNKIDTRTV